MHAKVLQNIEEFTWSRVPVQRFQRGTAMWVDMEGLMSNRALTTCTRTSTCWLGPLATVDRY